MEMVSSRGGQNGLAKAVLHYLADYPQEEGQRPEYFRMLRSKPVNRQDKNGKTALMYACEGCLPAVRGNTEIVKMLIEIGANPSIVDNNGNSAFDIANYENIKRKKDYGKRKEARKAMLKKHVGKKHLFKIGVKAKRSSSKGGRPIPVPKFINQDIIRLLNDGVVLYEARVNGMYDKMCEY